MIHYRVMSSRARLLLILGLAAALGVTVLAVSVLAGGGGESGIRGVVVTGCIRPPPPLTRCPETRVSAAQRVLRSSEGRLTLVKQFRSKEDGSFKVELAPGRYVIEPLPDQDFAGRLQPTEANVEESKFTPVRLFYDTGFR
jgi:hypothetical protein